MPLPKAMFVTAATGYDADASNSSADLNLSSSHEDKPAASGHFDMSTLHEEISLDEAPSKVAKVPFCPISEDTMYLEEPSGIHLALPNHNSSFRSSPVSMDSWMVYSSNSSDDFRLDDSVNSSEETSSDTDMGNAVKRGSDFGKRPRVKACQSYGPVKKKAQKRELVECVPQNLVDIRMIDFAHTTFANINSDSGKVVQETPVSKFVSNTTVHHGPDCGFLTGIDSLRRMLSEIIKEA